MDGMGPMKRYDGKNVYLVGGSAGIGLSAAKLFAARGANVLLLARRDAQLQHAATEVAKAKVANTQRLEWRTLDVSHHDEVLAWISTAANSPDKGSSRGLARYAVSSSVAPFHQGTATCC